MELTATWRLQCWRHLSSAWRALTGFRFRTFWGILTLILFHLPTVQHVKVYFVKHQKLDLLAPISSTQQLDTSNSPGEKQLHPIVQPSPTNPTLRRSLENTLWLPGCVKSGTRAWKTRAGGVGGQIIVDLSPGAFLTMLDYRANGISLMNETHNTLLSRDMVWREKMLFWVFHGAQITL